MIGGTGAYTYDIGNGPQNSGIFTNVTQGSYTVVVDDGTCSSSITVSIACPSAMYQEQLLQQTLLAMD